MAYQGWNTKCKVCGCRLEPGEGEFVSYPEQQALCVKHFTLWKQEMADRKATAKAKRETEQQKKLNKPTLFD
jgi:hypothetical protein